jgi:hypothetical protein
MAANFSGSEAAMPEPSRLMSASSIMLAGVPVLLITFTTTFRGVLEYFSADPDYIYLLNGLNCIARLIAMEVCCRNL